MGSWSSNGLQRVNSLWTRDAIDLGQQWLTAPSHYLNQCWLIIHEVQWKSPECNFTRAIDKQTLLEITYLRIHSNAPGDNELTKWQCIRTVAPAMAARQHVTFETHFFLWKYWKSDKNFIQLFNFHTGQFSVYCLVHVLSLYHLTNGNHSTWGRQSSLNNEMQKWIHVYLSLHLRNIFKATKSQKIGVIAKWTNLSRTPLKLKYPINLFPFLQLLSRSRTRRFHLQEPDLQISRSDLT